LAGRGTSGSSTVVVVETGSLVVEVTVGRVVGDVEVDDSTPAVLVADDPEQAASIIAAASNPHNRRTRIPYLSLANEIYRS
jgi:hypothetical protein